MPAMGSGGSFSHTSSSRKAANTMWGVEVEHRIHAAVLVVYILECLTMGGVE